MRPAFRLAVLAAALTALAGCTFEKKKEAPPCPRISILGDAAKLTAFRPGGGRDVTDVEVEAEFASYHGSCNYDWDSRMMTVDMKVGIDAHRGPGAQGRKFDLAYFIAVPAFYPDPKAKLVMPVSLTFPESGNRTRYTDEEVEIKIPIEHLRDLPKYQIYMGFQLTPEQVDYNRRQRHESP